MFRRGKQLLSKIGLFNKKDKQKDNQKESTKANYEGHVTAQDVKFNLHSSTFHGTSKTFFASGEESPSEGLSSQSPSIEEFSSWKRKDRGPYKHSKSQPSKESSLRARPVLHDLSQNHKNTAENNMNGQNKNGYRP